MSTREQIDEMAATSFEAWEHSEAARFTLRSGRSYGDGYRAGFNTGVDWIFASSPLPQVVEALETLVRMVECDEPIRHRHLDHAREALAAAKEAMQ